MGTSGELELAALAQRAKRAPPSTTVSVSPLAARLGPREYLLHEKWQMLQISLSL